MSNDLMVVEAEQFETTQRVAKAMVASGYFKDTQDIAQAVVKIMAGQEMGIAPFAAMTGIHIIKGKPALGANLIASKIKNDLRYDFRVLKLDDTAAVIAFYENGQKIGESEFTAKDAKRAGTQNMGKFPRNMLFARAISNGAKWYTPGIFGGAPVYTPDELGAEIDEEGDILEAVVIEPEPNRPEPDEPLPDDEQVIIEVAADEWMTTVIALIDRYDNAPYVQNTLKQLGYTGLPKGNGEKALQRLEMYRALKEQAAKRDAEDLAKLEATE